ncbi:DUF5360 family protein [Actinomycetes bacterium KLBMP 9759]
MRAVRVAMLVTDIGFVVYWAVTALGVLPPEIAYSDYTDPRVVAWNWSFMPPDLLISATGLTGLWLMARGHELWRPVLVISLTVTATSGLFAISYWAVRGEFDPLWWGVNLFLIAYAVPALVWLLRTPTPETVR